MTILVLDLKFDGTEAISTDAHLIRHPLEVERTFWVYLVSFIVLGMYRIAPTLQFHHGRRVDRGMIWVMVVHFFPEQIDCVMRRFAPSAHRDPPA
jgi:uncharacterized membrane protein